MNKLISFVLLVVGIVLLAYGCTSSDSLSSHFSRFFTSSPTDKTIWLIVGGAVAVLAGAAGLGRRSTAA